VKLSVLKRNQAIQEIDLGKDVLSNDYSETIFLIGRSKDCHIVLDDKKISREHARIIHRNNKWFIEKTSPDNICQINGEDFQNHELKVGDVFSVEYFSVIVVSQDEIKPTAPAVVAAPILNKTTETPIDFGQEEPSDSKNSETMVFDSGMDFEEAPEESEAEKPRTPPVSKKTETTDDFAEASDDVQFQEEPAEDLGMDFENREEGTKSESEDPLVGQPTDAGFDIETEDNNGGNALVENTSYSLSNIENEDNSGTKVIQSFASVFLELFGDTAPYDRFIIEKEKTYIGRDPSKCQIVLNDSEVSSVHAVVTRNNIAVTLEDLNSSNGTLFNGDRVNKVNLGHNDEFVIGGVTFTVKIRSEYLKDESATLMAVDENQSIEVEEVVEVQLEDGEHIDALGNTVTKNTEKSILKRIWKDEDKRKKLIYGLVLLVGAWFMFDEEKPAPKQAAKKAETVKPTPQPTAGLNQKKLTDEQKRAFSALYEIGKDHYNHGRYREALNELLKIAAVDPNFNSNLQPLISFSKEGLRKIEEEEKKRQADLQSAERKAKVKELVEKAREYTKDRRVDLANKTFTEITTLDPENLEVTRMKLELEDWIKEKQRKELEEAQKKKERDDKVDKLKPGRTLYLQKEWFKAISKLEDFLRIKNMDDDLTTEATEMLKVSREELNSAVAPLIGKAKSLLEGQDLKGAYEVYQQILRIEPSNAEALNQMGDIKEQLTNRARKIYREAIISESLSLFQDAKEKFQEVQQISPVDTPYYKKATDKLRDYLE
jgi:pSer/pThr/pTyr-binding forkhead associated (FHA) protein